MRWNMAVDMGHFKDQPFSVESPATEPTDRTRDAATASHRTRGLLPRPVNTLPAKKTENPPDGVSEDDSQPRASAGE